MSYDDIIGAANYDIIGQYGGYPMAIGQQLAIGQDGSQVITPTGNVPINPTAVADQIAARESFLVAPRTPVKARREILGFGRTVVGPGETVEIIANPQVLFQPYRLIIPSNSAFQFVIHQIRFGKWNLLANGGAVPAVAFIETAEDSSFNGETVQPNSQIVLTVQNTSDADAEFQAGMWGKAVE